MKFRALLVAVALFTGADALVAEAAGSQKLDVDVRGKTLTLTVYEPKPGAQIRGTILMGSGDVGWVGLATTLATFLSNEGYIVAGINARQYLSAFAIGADHLTIEQVPADYGLLAAALRSRSLLVRPVILSGVSEGAALAVAAAASPGAHQWVDGVLTMGLPATAELAWRWKDVMAWVFTKDANEPSFSPHEIIGRVSPVPLWMIHSTTDEYVEKADYRRFESVAKEPKKLVLIDAKNHRFTDKMPQLKAEILAGFAWFDNLSGLRSPSASAPSAAPRDLAPPPGLSAVTRHGG
jgi:dienelactone hydrolase